MSELPPKPARIAFFGAGPLPSEDSAFAPGIANRLWHFLQPALAAGHDCLLFSIENAATGELITENRNWRGRPWRCVRARVDDCKNPQRLAPIIDSFKPDVLIGAGTILASWTACQLAGERAVWGDFFGDPLAEIAVKAEVLGANFNREEQNYVWRMMLAILARADAFSTVSRRQADALLGQVLLAGRPSAKIATLPCALESLNLFGDAIEPSAHERVEFLGKYGIPADARIALWSGGFNAWADPDTLVDGMEVAMDREPRLHFVSTGGELPDYLTRVYERFTSRAAASAHAQQFHPLGWLPMEQAARWLCMADLGVITDRECSETRFGSRNRLLYFAAARRPVVASRGSEVVEEMEAAGALIGFNNGDAAALADAVLALINDSARARAIAEQGFAFAAKHYEFAASAGAFLDFVNKPNRAQQGAAWIAQYLDTNARDAQEAELARYRSGRLSRLMQIIKKAGGF